QLEALRGPQGETGARGAQGPPGEKGDPGERGPQGEKGNTGEGFRLADQFDSFAELEAAVPEPEAGSAYGVGTAPPYDVYIYSPSKGWVNHGPLQGAKGDPGPQGEIGEQGPQGIPGEPGPQGPTGERGAAFTYSDFTAEQLEGLRGPQGVQGDPGTGDVSGVLFTVGLPAEGWENGAQAVHDTRFDAAGRFAYVVSPDGASFAGYTENGVHAVEVTDGNRLVFSAESAPAENLTVHILRLEVPENGEDF
ncbi:collagen-like protein, partial [Clostridiaceae bacterium]|nr:collagen-like protein [Clostridiaceae bacterium]